MSLIDVRPGLRAYLMADSGIAALVDTRIYPVKAPQGQVLPHIIYHFISGQGDRHMQGRSGLSRPRIQVDCWAGSIDVAVALALQVKERIEGFRGAWPWDAGSVDVRGCFFESERDDYDPDAQLYLASHDYLIWYDQG